MMATEDPTQETEIYYDSLEDMDLEQLGKTYSAVVMQSWEEAYESFNDFVFQFKKEFGKGRNNGRSIAAYDEMMEKSAESLGRKNDEYDGSGMDLEHVQNAFIYGEKGDPDIEEFREAVTSILEENKEWIDYAREHH